MSARQRAAPVRIVLYGDVLDPWCWIADRRIGLVVDELHGRFLPLEHAPFPRAWSERAPTSHERRLRANEIARAAKEPDAPPLSTDLWTGAAGPLSSAPPLVAVAAACLQSRAGAERLRAALREAALVRGLDVTRRDVLLEVAARTGLDLARFVPALDAAGTARAVEREVKEGRELGVRSSPALVIADDWLVKGARSLRNYRLLFKHYLATRAGAPVQHTVH